MSQEMTEEYERLLDEYKKLKEIVKEIRDRIAEIQKQIYKEKQKHLPKNERVCTYCGSTNYYARGYCKSCYQKFMMYGTPEGKPRQAKQPKPKSKRQIWLEKDFKGRIYNDVVGKDRPEGEESPEDWEEGIYHALSTLTPKEETFMLSRYKDGLTLKACGESIGGLTTERARQIINRALRKLRHPSRLRYIKYGMERAKEMKQEEEREELEAAREKEELKRLAIEKQKEEQEMTIEELRESARKFNVSIEEFDLSVRAFNALARANLVNRAAILQGIIEDGGDAAKFLIKIRNCGRKTVEEIIEKLYIPYTQPNI